MRCNIVTDCIIAKIESSAVLECPRCLLITCKEKCAIFPNSDEKLKRNQNADSNGDTTMVINSDNQKFYVGFSWLLFTMMSL